MMFEADSFIGAILDKDSWRITDTRLVSPEVFRGGPDSFCYAKVDCSAISEVQALESAGFHLVDTNVTLEWQNSESRQPTHQDKNYEVRMADSADAKATEELAAQGFVCSRFHLDPMVSDRMASEIKRQWAGNYFKGQRGDWMIVANHHDTIVGFNQILRRDDALIIDLIAVHPDHRGKGLATAMIRKAAIACGGWQRMLVGTQIANIPSLCAYQKLGFRMRGSSYVFHYHGPVQANS